MMNTLFLREHNRLVEIRWRNQIPTGTMSVCSRPRNINIVLLIKIAEEYINHVRPIS
jgi:hypothetical protein